MKKLLAVSMACFAMLGASVQAQDYPIKDKTISIVVPFAAGGPTDKVARDLAVAMGKTLGGTIVVENVAGASGSIGANKIAKANPDGYSLLLFHIGQASLPTMIRKLPYNVENDFEFLGMVNDVPMTLVGRNTLPANNFAELRKWANDNKGKINLANAGPGSASHMCGMMFQSAMAIDMTTVPYKGTAPAMNDLLGGQVDIMCDQTTNTSAQIEGKKIKAFGVTTPKRVMTAALKDVPTLNEAGLKDFQVSIWHGLYGPKGMPAPVAKKINEAMKAALKDPDFIKRQEGLGAIVVTDKRMEPAEHKKFVVAEIAKWGPVIKAAGAYAD
ncbi:MAG TPA: tripartite tricarboxylate transporter substrate-binding protein [Burkholderiaceae bacterium]|nr:tripartite tricarboxylate transporter substrate-binding protein [Burkholderiaceae bacterium]